MQSLARIALFGILTNSGSTSVRSRIKLALELREEVGGASEWVLLGGGSSCGL